MGDRGERRFRVDTYASKLGVSPAPQDLELEDLYSLLGHEETDCLQPDGTPGCRGKTCPEKDGLAWTAGFINEPCRCGPRSESTDKTHRCIHCGKKTRFASNVAGLDLAVFDIDGISEQQRDEMCERLEGTELYLHTTHTHLPPENNNYRLVFPLTRTITPKEWVQLWFAIIRKFALPTAKKHGVDAATKDPARLSFFPRALRGRPFVNVHGPGTMLNPDELLLENVKHSREAVKLPQAPRAEAGSIDLGDLKGFLRRYDPEDDDPVYNSTPEYQKGAVVQRILKGEPLAEKGFRGLTTLRAGTLTGLLLPLDTSADAAMELLRPSMSQIPSYEGDGPKDNFDAWMASARRGFEGAQEKKRADLADEESARGLLAAVFERKKAAEWKWGPESVPAAVQAPTPSQDATTGAFSGVPSSGGPPGPSGPPVDPDAWRMKLITTIDKQGVPRPKNTATNIGIILENHPAWKGVLRYNKVTNEPESCGGPIPESKRDPDRMITAIRDWLVKKEEIDQPRFEVEEYVNYIARENMYDPVTSYLLESKHDSERRINTWLIRYCGVKVIDDNGLDVTEYVMMVGERWLMACVARGLYPGCKADNVLVFEGDQYVGKSRVLDILGGDWFADTQLNLNDKSTFELASKSWIIELSELSSMKKSETESQKSFFSKRADNFRLSYAKRVRKFARRCVFAGTTNEKKYLLDLTGNRRFWCVWCTKMDLVGLRRDRDQLWAEATAKVRAGETCPKCFEAGGGKFTPDERCPEHRWWLDEAETAFAERVAATRMNAPYADVIRSWWLNKEPGARPEHLTLKDVLVNVLDLKVDRLEQYQTAIGRAMKVLGFERERVRRQPGSEREWVYMPSAEFKSAPRVRSTARTAAEVLEEGRATQPVPGLAQ